MGGLLGGAGLRLDAARLADKDGAPRRKSKS